MNVILLCSIFNISNFLLLDLANDNFSLDSFIDLSKSFQTFEILQSFIFFDFSSFSLNNLSDEREDESLFSRAENIFFLAIPLLYLYISNIVKIAHFFEYGEFSSNFTDIEKRYIWISIVAISINIVIDDIF